MNKAKVISEYFAKVGAKGGKKGGKKGGEAKVRGDQAYYKEISRLAVAARKAKAKSKKAKRKID